MNIWVIEVLETDSWTTGILGINLWALEETMDIPEWAFRT